MLAILEKRPFFLSVVFFIFLALFFASPVFGAELSWMGRPVVDRVNDLILFILKIIGGIFLLMFVLGGIYYSISGSSSDGQKKAKKIITYAILGLVIVLTSYGIIALLDRFLVQP